MLTLASCARVVPVLHCSLSKDDVSDPRGATTFCGTPEYLGEWWWWWFWWSPSS